MWISPCRTLKYTRCPIRQPALTWGGIVHTTPPHDQSRSSSVVGGLIFRFMLGHPPQRSSTDGGALNT
jgi:hypothetical protein